jgi:hypothetical protein
MSVLQFGMPTQRRCVLALRGQLWTMGGLSSGITLWASDFAAGSIFNFLVSYLEEGITDAVRNANHIQRATFPCEWLSLSTLDSLYSMPPAGTPPTHWGNLPTTMAQALATAPRLAPSTPKEDTRHPKIKLLMDPYLKQYNNFLNLLEILTSLGKGMTDLPSLPQYCQPTGQLFLCWNSKSASEAHGADT